MGCRSAATAEDRLVRITASTPEEVAESPSSGEQERPSDDPELAAVIAAWSSLPAAVRAGIVAMVRAARRP
jgi:hypothetical protein